MSTTAPDLCPRYRPRSPTNLLKEIVEDHLEELTQNYDERLLGTYGPLHPRVRELFERFLRCGDLHFGFMRLYCDDCRENKYIPHSCNVRGLCPSCGQKRALLWAERLVEEVLPDTPYSQIVYTIPKMLRKAFLFRRDLYGELCRVAYASTREFLAAHYPGLHDPVPAMIAVPQSHGNLLQPHAHLHALCSLGVYDREGKFYPTPDDFDFAPLEEIFREKTLKMLLDSENGVKQKGKSSQKFVNNNFSWDKVAEQYLKVFLNY